MLVKVKPFRAQRQSPFVRWHCALLVLLFTLTYLPLPSTLFAQEESDEPGRPRTEGTLPEIEVRPEATESPVEQDFPPGDFDPFPSEPSLSELLDDVYPPLADQWERQFDGGSRSNRSVLEEPMFKSIIGSQELQERMPGEMFDAIEREVGVMVQRTQRGAAAPFIRGLTGQQVLILVDGIRLNNATFRSGPNQYFNTIDPGTVERIEVLRGPQSVLYGADAIGGVINVVTRSASERFVGDYVGGQWIHRYSTADSGNYSRMNVEGSYQNASFFGGGAYANYNNLDRGGNLGRQPGTDYALYSGDIKMDYLIGDLQMLTVAVQHFVQEDVTRSDRLPGRLTVFDPQQRDLVYVRMQGADLPGWFDRYMFTASYHRQREGERDRRLSSNNLDIGEVDNHTFGLSLVMSTNLNWWGRLTYGTDLYYDTVDSSRTRLDANTGGLIGPRTPKFPDGSVYSQQGAFLEWSVELSERLSAVSGVRYTNIYASGTPTIEVDDDNDPNTPDVAREIFVNPGFGDWTGSIGLNLEVTEGFHLVGSIAEGFRAPNLDDLVATNTNVQQAAVDTPSVNLDPEHSLSYDVGAKLDTRRFHAQAYYFWMDIDNMILRTPAGVSGADVLFSRSNRNSHIHGFETAGELLVRNGWSLYGNLSYYLGNDEERMEPLSRIPPLQGILGLRWRDPCGRSYFDVYAWMVDNQDRLNFQDVRDRRIPPGGTPGFATVNFRTGRQLSPHQRVSLNVENIFDRAYRVHGSGVDGPGINAIFGYELQY